MAPVLKALERDPQAECVVCVTGQHEELLASVLSLFRIRPHYQLRVMSHNQQLCGLTSRLLAELEKVIVRRAARLGAGTGRYDISDGGRYGWMLFEDSCGPH